MYKYSYTTMERIEIKEVICNGYVMRIDNQNKH